MGLLCYKYTQAFFPGSRNKQVILHSQLSEIFFAIIIENSSLTELVRSRWLDISLVLFLRIYEPRPCHGPHQRKIVLGQHPAIVATLVGLLCYKYTQAFFPGSRNKQVILHSQLSEIFFAIIIENSSLTELVRSRWLDISLVLFLRIYEPRPCHGPHQRKIVLGQHPAIVTSRMVNNS